MSYRITGTGSCIPDIAKKNSDFLKNKFLDTDTQNALDNFNRIMQTNHKDLQSLIDEYWVPEQRKFFGIFRESAGWRIPEDKIFKVLGIPI